jgi:uncharacterized membrane protein YdbT with pleckstrin-like domain
MEQHLRPAWRSQLGGLTILLVFAAVTALGLVDPVTWGLLAVAGALALMVLLAVLLYRHYAHLYYVEDGRIEHRRGILGRHIRSVRLADLRNVNLRQSIVERLLGIGTIEFSSAGGSGVEVSWAGVRDPVAVKRHIEGLRAGDGPRRSQAESE